VNPFCPNSVARRTAKKPEIGDRTIVVSLEANGQGGVTSILEFLCLAFLPKGVNIILVLSVK
jgi:hypothetical protein